MPRKNLPYKLKTEILRRDSYRCHRCGLGQGEVELNINHIIPVSQGGSDEPSNLSTLCRFCHREWEVVEPFDIQKKLVTYKIFISSIPLRLFFPASSQSGFDGLTLREFKQMLCYEPGCGTLPELKEGLNTKPSKLGQSRNKMGHGLSSWSITSDTVYNLVIELRQRGESFEWIARHLDEMDERDASGKRFSASAVKKLLESYLK